jgi:radical SAM family protein/B12 binding protein
MKKPTAVIAIPSICDFYTTPHRLSALGEIIVQQILQRQGWETRFLHFPKAAKHVLLPLPQVLAHLEPCLLPGEFGPTAFFSRYHRFGPTPEQGADIILSEKPDAVFLSCFAFAYADDTLALAGQIKKQRPTLPVYVGGAGASVLPEYFMRAGCIDTVISGEAEKYLTRFLAGTPAPDDTAGFSAKRSDRPDVAIATMKSSKKGLWLTTALSRGCPRKCAFCANHLTQGRTFRTVSIEAFLSAMDTLPRDIPIHVNFEDDNFLMDKNFFFDVLQAIRQKFPRVDFSAENGMDYGLLDLETLQRLIACGFRQFNLSMASIRPSILKDARRWGDPQRLQELLLFLARQNIPSITYFICGLAQDTVDSVIQNLQFLYRQPTRVGISLFYPVPGLPGFENAQSFKASASHLCTGSAAYPWSGSLTTAQMVTAFRLARYINLSKQNHCRPEAFDLLTRIQKEGRLYTYQRSKGKKRMVRPPGLDHEMEAGFFGSLADPGT